MRLDRGAFERPGRRAMNSDPHFAVILDPFVPRFFNLLEAERLLPEVERLIRGLIGSKHEYEDADAQLTRIAQRIAFAGGMIPPREQVAFLRQRKDSAARSLKTAFERVQEIGFQVKDLETGLVDFPTLYRDEEVYLCWRLGESGITFWHHIADGFRGWRPINGEFLENHRGASE
jgi:hypothetical protein